MNHYEKNLPMDHLGRHPVGDLRDICQMADAVRLYLLSPNSLSWRNRLFEHRGLLPSVGKVSLSDPKSAVAGLSRHRGNPVRHSGLLFSLYAADLGGNCRGADVYSTGLCHPVLGSGHKGAVVPAEGYRHWRYATWLCFGVGTD